jgi:hypothetical protein
VTSLVLLVACEGGLGERAPGVLDCASPTQVARLRNIHYPEDECAAARGKAEAHVTAAYYRKSCQQLAPAAGLPAKVSDVLVSGCEPASGHGLESGSVLQIEICCPDPD